MRVGNPGTTQKAADENLYAEARPIADHFRRGLVLDQKTKELRAARYEDTDVFVNPPPLQVRPEDVIALYTAAAESPRAP